jgi:hypothetical protein
MNRLRHWLLAILIASFAVLLNTATPARAQEPQGLGNFEIQTLVSQYNQAETLASSVVSREQFTSLLLPAVQLRLIGEGVRDDVTSMRMQLVLAPAPTGRECQGQVRGTFQGLVANQWYARGNINGTYGPSAQGCALLALDLQLVSPLTNAQSEGVCGQIRLRTAGRLNLRDWLYYPGGGPHERGILITQREPSAPCAHPGLQNLPAVYDPARLGGDEVAWARSGNNLLVRLDNVRGLLLPAVQLAESAVDGRERIAFRQQINMVVTSAGAANVVRLRGQSTIWDDTDIVHVLGIDGEGRCLDERCSQMELSLRLRHSQGAFELHTSGMLDLTRGAWTFGERPDLGGANGSMSIVDVSCWVDPLQPHCRFP